MLQATNPTDTTGVGVIKSGTGLSITDEREKEEREAVLVRPAAHRVQRHGQPRRLTRGFAAREAQTSSPSLPAKT